MNDIEIRYAENGEFPEQGKPGSVYINKLPTKNEAQVKMGTPNEGLIDLLPTATYETKGGVTIGNTLTVENGVVGVPPETIGRGIQHLLTIQDANPYLPQISVNTITNGPFTKTTLQLNPAQKFSFQHTPGSMESCGHNLGGVWLDQDSNLGCAQGDSELGYLYLNKSHVLAALNQQNQYSNKVIPIDCLPKATTQNDKPGIVSVGDNITLNDGEISLTSKNVAHALKISNSFEFNSNQLKLKPATTSVLGGVTTGANITNDNGKLSVTKNNVTAALGYTPPKVTSSSAPLSMDSNTAELTLKLDGTLKTTSNNLGINFSSTSVIDELFKILYPVGSIYMTVNDITTQADPAGNNMIIWHGCKWERWGGGRVPVGVTDSNGYDDGSGKAEFSKGYFNIPDASGGEYRHTLSTHEMPSHNHRLMVEADRSGHGGTLDVYTEYGSYVNNLTTSGGAGTAPRIAYGGSEGSNLQITTTGSGGAHNNLQPYITCYMWKRIS